MKTEKNSQEESKKKYQDNLDSIDSTSSSSEASSTLADEKDSETSKGKKTGKIQTHLRKNVVFYLLLVTGAIFIFQQQLSFNSKMKDAQNALAEEKETIVVNAQKTIDINNEQTLTMGMKTFVWAIRREMLNENYEQVNQYILQLIKNKNISEIIITDQEGNITYSSNKKFEQTPFANQYDYDLLAINDIKIEKVNEDRLYLITPIMSFNSKLGFVFMVYHSVTPAS